jgi:hypothetical protein
MNNSPQNRFKKLIIPLGLLALLFACLQTASPSLKNPPVKKEIELPQDVKQIIVRACYDCHSNQADPAWFDRIAPAPYLVAHDIKEGRALLNFQIGIKILLAPKNCCYGKW